MKPRMGKNVVFVRLLARENKNDVAAETGELKFSYSSSIKSQCDSIYNGVCLVRTDGSTNVLRGIRCPQLLLAGVEAHVWVYK